MKVGKSNIEAIFYKSIKKKKFIKDNYLCFRKLKK